MAAYVQPFRNSLLQVHKSTTANEENILRINLQCTQVRQACLETVNTSASYAKTIWLTGTFVWKQMQETPLVLLASTMRWRAGQPMFELHFYLIKFIP
jgi:hypothetical protein